MRKILPLLPLLVASLGALAQRPAPPPAPQTRLLVRLQDHLRDELRLEAGAARPAAELFDRVNRQHRAEQVTALNPGKHAASAPAMYLIALPTGTDARQAQLDYEQTGLFRYVELDAVGEGGGAQGVVPNDFYYGRQWYLKNNGTFGQSPATAGADIKMEDAWTITKGDSSVTVAIIDSGIKLDHPEFAGRIWRNRREIAGNGLDDDGNGYVDDVKGWSFVTSTNNVTDDLGHGTNVAGIIGATGNNIGYAGVNWACKLMVLKGLTAQNTGFYSWWTSGIYYAVDNGARVINMSLGGTGTSQAMQDAISYATQRGVVVVACMMNTNTNVPYYPAALTGVISVGATNPNDTRANPFSWSATSGSNYGPHISVVAPGNYIYGLDYQSNTNYNTYWGGTSQATPQVVGLASLLLTLRPSLTPAQVKSIVESTADDRVGGQTEDVPGWDPYFGYGRINAPRALASVVTAARPGAAAAASFQLFPNPSRGEATLQLLDARLLRQPVQIFNALGQLVSQQTLSGLTQQLVLPAAAGTYWVAVAGTGGGQRLVVE
ncbi:S8 family serine peptidase [Hymenobacter sp. 5317J-9]|uniref:S8 family serine peptidase n=1 Tax=Hymenobacter sp. 5317J-9 TaxID=2932250 RepID=UPI001FD7040F|nr:S8 family serine peptidase [Hymenobacter sp. 5317J-9]UOQ95983.1 S8 family serine peptidase [Hymenobacter sp. 5317J-9]